MGCVGNRDDTKNGTDADGDGWTASEDCDDTNADIHPGATEVCDATNTDEDCDGQADDDDDSVDPATRALSFFDGDEDSYGADSDAGTPFCDPPANYVADNADCDDANAEINPGATEVCDDADTDEDCNGLADDADIGVDTSTYGAWYDDGDSDSYGDDTSTPVQSCDAPSVGFVDNNGDCNDGDSTINPSSDEICDDADTDEDCNGLIDDADPGVDSGAQTTWYPDADGDGHGDATDPGTALCEAPVSGFTTDFTDCDDDSPQSYPGAAEVCDGVMNDCDNSSWTSDAGIATWVDTAGSATDMSATLGAGAYGAPVFQTIATDGTLSICEGTWYVGLTVTGTDVVVEGPEGAANTVISGGGTTNVMRIETSGAAVAVLGLTLTEGYGCYGAGIAGGQIFECTESSATIALASIVLELYDVVISDNEDRWSSNGAITIANSSVLYMEDTEVSNNSASGISASESDVECVGSASSSAGVWGNGGYGIEFQSRFSSGARTLTSDTCDFGTGSNDNGSADVYIAASATGSNTYTYGDDESFTCSTGTSTCF